MSRRQRGSSQAPNPAPAAPVYTRIDESGVNRRITETGDVRISIKIS